jgi:hypothetical protein
LNSLPHKHCTNKTHVKWDSSVWKILKSFRCLYEHWAQFNYGLKFEAMMWCYLVPLFLLNFCSSISAFIYFV